MCFMIVSGVLGPVRALLLCAVVLCGLSLVSAPQTAFADDVGAETAATSGGDIFVDNGDAAKDVVYLSDIPYVSARVGWGAVTLDKNGVNNGGLVLNVNGSAVTFKKGIFAHATSSVDYDVSEYHSDYPYFMTYYGLNTSNDNNGNGVKFYVYVSNDRKTWELKTDANPVAIKSGNGAYQIKVDVRDYKYIRLHANDNGNNGSDHAVWADAKLVREDYKDNVTRTVEELDAEIKAQYTSGPVPEDLQLLLLQRNLIASVGQYGLRTFLETSPANREMLEWFINDEDALRMWTMAGAPRGSYVSSLQVLSNLYAAHKDDLADDTVSHGVRNGDLNLRMMLSLSLTHASAVNLWIFNNQTSNAVTRYEIFKDMYANDKLGDPTMFANLTVQEMRGVMMNQIDDEEILWLRDWTAKESPDRRFNPYNYITYRKGYSYGQPKYYSAENYAKWDAKYNLSQYHLTYRSGCPKLWIVFEQGAVCGGLSKTGANIYGSWGYPSWPVGQPGHCAYIYMYNAGGGRNAWQLTNSIAANGWANTTPANMPYGWGAGGANVTNNGTIQSASYLLLAQEAQNEYEKFEKANMLMTLAKVYRTDWDMLKQIYADAYEEEHINLDVWNGLVNIALDSRTGSSQEDLYELAEQCVEDMKYHPLPMYDLTRRLGAKITDPVVKAKFMMLIQSTLQNMSRVNSSQHLQAKEINAVANALLGVTNNRVAEFSFDGENANKLILSRAFQGAGVVWEYSLDGGTTWTEVYEDSVTLTPEQIASISARNDIKVHIIGAPREGNTFTIDITQSSFSTSGLSSNDEENRIFGTTSLMEYYVSDNLSSTTVPADATWSSFSVAPNLEGNKRLFIRNRATGTSLASNYVYYTYHANVITEERNYISPSHLTVDAKLTTKTGEGATKNLLDGNANTYWRSANNVMPAYITLKLDEPRYVNSLEFTPDPKCKFMGIVPNGYPKKVNIQVSMDGVNWETVSTQNWPENNNVKTVNFTATQALYVRVECVTDYTEGTETKRMACTGIKLYEDLTVDPTPKAKVHYDITSKTNHDVVAELVDATKPITVTNTENGALTHTFTENGDFTFEFVDADGNTGSATAHVDWIDKDVPSAEITYSTTNPTNGDVVAEMTFDEPVTIVAEDVSILNEDGTAYEGALTSGPNTVTFVENDTIDITFVDEAGNEGHQSMAVDWIDREEPTGTVTYSTNDITDEPVVATVEPSEEGVTILSEGGDTHTFDSNGTFTFELMDAAGNVGTVDASVHWIKHVPTVEVSFSKGAGVMTKGTVDATVTFPEGYRIMNNGGSNTHTFTENGEFVFQYIDPDGMQGSYPVTVDWIDNEAPIAEITYDISTATNKNVTAMLTLEDPSGPVTITSEGGNTHTFTENGEFTFEFRDGLGNEGTATAAVDWINKDAPTATISYSTTNKTKDEVIATLEPEKDITIVNTDGVDISNDGTITHTFTENGEFVFEFEDGLGNRGTATARVDWIDRNAPTATIRYSTTDKTKDAVVATLEPSESVIATNTDGVDISEDGTISHTFTENGEFTFEFEDEVGNAGTATARVDWIDKDALVATVSYSTTDKTKDAVIATLEPNKTITMVNTDGVDISEDGTITHTFTENGEFVFEFRDEVGNEGTVTAKVSWIDKDAPTATVSYSTTDKTNGAVIATLEPSEPITITDTDGVDISKDGTITHTFDENGEFVFEFEDAAGNAGTVTAKVSWIDREAPTATVNYSTIDKTKDPVIATLESSEHVTIVNTDGVDISKDGIITHTFNENGEFIFEFEDEAGNKGTAAARVDWIEKDEPENPDGPDSPDGSDNPGGSETPGPDGTEKPDEKPTPTPGPDKPENPDKPNKPGNPGGNETPDTDIPVKPEPGKPGIPNKPGKPDGDKNPGPGNTNKPNNKPTLTPGPGALVDKPAGSHTPTHKPGHSVTKPGNNSVSGGSAGSHKPGHSSGSNNSKPKPSKKPSASVVPQSNQSGMGIRSTGITNSAPDHLLPSSGNNSSVSTPSSESGHNAGNSTAATPEPVAREDVAAGMTGADTHQNGTASPTFLDTDTKTTSDDGAAADENTEEEGVNWLLILALVGVPVVAAFAFFAVRAMRMEADTMNEEEEVC